jgi:hypothetical protein
MPDCGAAAIAAKLASLWMLCGRRAKIMGVDAPRHPFRRCAAGLVVDYPVDCTGTEVTK